MLGDSTKHHLLGLMGIELLVDWCDVHDCYLTPTLTGAERT
jgi:hypothetical protein